jgi:hypothetical protein
VRFARPLWRKLATADLVDLRKRCLDSIAKYYERIESQNEDGEPE